MANEVRTGLNSQTAMAQASSSKTKVHPLDELWMGKRVRQHVREFGAVFGTLFLVIAGYQLYKGNESYTPYAWSGAAIVISTLGYVAPAVLRPLWQGWMKFAHLLSVVMTTVILGIVWCIGFLPMAALVRALGIKVIDSSYGKADTYWVKRDPKYDDFSRLKQQY